MHKYYKKMKIDEKKEQYDISDHNQIDITFSVKTQKPIYTDEVREIQYYKIDESTIPKYIEDIENALNTEEVTNQEDFDNIVKRSADKTLKRVIKRKITEDKQEIVPIWFGKDIKEAISKRREYNKKKRNAKTEREKQENEDLWQQQKQIVQKMVKEAVTTYERNTTKRIMEDPNRSKKLWENIHLLKNNKKKDLAKITLVDENGNPIDIMDVPKKLQNSWQAIYQKHDNKIPEVWNDNMSQQYREKLNERRENNDLTAHLNRQGRVHMQNYLREHMDMALTVEESTAYPMEEQEITTDDVIKQLTKMKKERPQGQMK